MKNVAYRLYALMFNTMSHLPVKEKRAALLSPHMAKFTDSLGEIEKELDRRGGYETVRISGTDIKPVKSDSFTENLKSLVKMLSFFTVKAAKLATSKYVFLNDNFMPMSDLKFKKETVITQLWHAEGAFKKFGLDLNLPQDVAQRVREGNNRLNYVVCTSEQIAPIYASAFGVPTEKMLPYGSPRADRYVSENHSPQARQEFMKAHSLDECKGIALYAPTFRDDPEDNSKILEHFDFERFDRELGDRFTLILRLHPQIHGGITIPDSVVDMTGLDDAGELIRASDILITDYSSICMDFALLGKPCVFYAYDLEQYGSERQFYFDYKSYVPGAVAQSFDELLTAVASARADGDKLKEFLAVNFGVTDGGAARRIVDRVIATHNK